MAHEHSVWNHVDHVMGGMESMLRDKVPGFGAGGVGDRILPAVRGEIRVDVHEEDDGVVVVADLPGIERENVTARLLSPRELEITGERRSGHAGYDAGELVRRERAYGRLRRVVPLPRDVTADCAAASFANGVLEVRLKKGEEERGERIPIL